MAKHNVYFDLPQRELGKADANFYIYQDGERLGKVTISKGGIEYFPFKRKKPIKMGWLRFSKLMENNE